MEATSYIATNDDKEAYPGLSGGKIMKLQKLVNPVALLVFAVFVLTVTPTSAAVVGVNVSGSEYSWETYPVASHLDYIKSKGVALIRLPVAWEKLQPALYGTLNPTEIKNLKAFLNLAASRNMQVILDIHNYGRYNPNWAANAAANYGIVAVSGTTGLVLGSSSLPISAFQDLWTKLASTLAGQAGLAGYDIMNEPHDLGPGVWPKAAQAAVNGIRSVDMTTTIYVEGTQYASAYYWPWDNGSLKINDPANNIVYEAHLYFDGDGSGRYGQTYDRQGAYPNWGVDHVQPFLNWLKQNNVKGFIGEFAVPENDPRWLVVLDNFLSTLNQAGVPSTYWYYAYADPSGANAWWPMTSGTDYSMSLIPYADGRDKPQWSIITKYASTTPKGTKVTVSDNFDRTNTNPMGGNWKTVTGTRPVKILNNRVVGTTDGVYNAAYWSANTFGANQCSRVTVISKYHYSAVLVRVTPSAQTFYMLSGGAGYPYRLFKMVNGIPTRIGPTFGDVNSGDVITLCVNGTTLTPYINGKAQTPQTDPTIASGAPGIMAFDTNCPVDNWSGWDQ